VLVYQSQLENLCDQAMREKDQKKLTKLMDTPAGSGESKKCWRSLQSTFFWYRSHEENTSNVLMPCKSCESLNQGQFTGEVAIHFPGLQNIDKPIVWVFPEIIVCLDCGTTEFTVPKSELRQLAKGDAAAAG
jgi:hypothetical protein